MMRPRSSCPDGEVPPPRSPESPIKRIVTLGQRADSGADAYRTWDVYGFGLTPEPLPRRARSKLKRGLTSRPPPIQWRTHGGNDTIENCVLVHPTCHQQIHNQGLTVGKPHPPRAFERLELHEGRLSCAVPREPGNSNAPRLPGG